ncbi:MAG: amidophosphoribosyltransferase [Rhizobiales bacterium]|nr:amidophosphoribosyltransferase [Hyphomicrobiales bacterium]NRB13010.1 amidophosphoribosyltransferase [Hyphomicrobiales bacterium]
MHEPLFQPNDDGTIIDVDDDKLHEECGIFGVFRHTDAPALTALGLHALQHRGQEAAGIVSFNGRVFKSQKRNGLVGDYFTKKSVLEKLEGHTAIGHARYSTTGDGAMRNLQPLYADLKSGGFACCHNGNFTNGLTLRKELVAAGAIYQSNSDSEALLHLVARSQKTKLTDKFIDAIKILEGGFALLAMTKHKLIGARDRFGIRPLVLGKLDGSYILCSETCALDIIGAEFVREVKNGEVVVITTDGIESFFPFGQVDARPCIFEYIYFARPDSVFDGKTVYEVRKDFGRELAKECPADIDMVVPVPDSGVPAAIGYAQESGVPFELAIIRNHYVGRTFIEPTQAIRELGVKLKLNPIRSLVKGKKVMLIDDSVVRGTTSVKIVKMMFEAGAKEVHMRVACPPIKYPDYYGIDMPTQKSLLAATHNLEQMRDFMGATSLGFMSIDGVYRALGHDGRNNDKPAYTDHYFTGDYPTNLQDVNDRMAGSQLSFLETDPSEE